MKGRPITFVCPAARAGRDVFNDYDLPPGHDRMVRTGRTRRPPGRHRRGGHTLAESVEYRCECGHRGWTTHPGVLYYPTEADRQAALLALVDNGSDCPSGKTQFVSREAARAASPERGFRAYHCDHCGCYHAAHVQRSQKRREVTGR